MTFVGPHTRADIEARRRAEAEASQGSTEGAGTLSSFSLIESSLICISVSTGPAKPAVRPMRFVLESGPNPLTMVMSDDAVGLEDVMRQIQHHGHNATEWTGFETVQCPPEDIHRHAAAVPTSESGEDEVAYAAWANSQSQPSPSPSSPSLARQDSFFACDESPTPAPSAPAASADTASGDETVSDSDGEMCEVSRKLMESSPRIDLKDTFSAKGRARLRTMFASHT